MSVDTAKVAGRRELHFESLDEMLAEAERLANDSDVELLGNWSLGQMCEHLASSLTIANDGTSFRPSFIWRLMGPWMKGRMLKTTFSPGFKLPKEMEQLIPGDTSTEQGLTALRNAASRFKSEPLQTTHFIFGKMSPEDWTKLQLRHAELHFSFAVQAKEESAGDGDKA